MFRANRSWACLWLSILVAFCCDCLPAQMTTGSTGGTVVDATDAVIPAAVVTLSNEGTGETRKAVSGGRGRRRWNPHRGGGAGFDLQPRPESMVQYCGVRSPAPGLSRQYAPSSLPPVPA